MCAGELSFSVKQPCPIYSASLPFTALHFLLPSPQVLTAITALEYSFPISVNTPPHSTLLVIFAVFPSLSDTD